MDATQKELTPLQKAHEKMVQMRAEGWKPVQMNPVDKAHANPRSLKMAIRANCWVCMGAGADSGVRLRVRDCSLENTCALWPHRPWQTAAGKITDDGEVIEEFAGDDDDAPDVAVDGQAAA